MPTTLTQIGPGLHRTTLLGDDVAFHLIPGSEPHRTPLVAIHGLGSDLRDLLDLARRTRGPVVLLDLPGFGRSSRPDRPYPVTRASQTVVALLDLLGWHDPIWLGCSYGGHVSLRAALDHPDRVRQLVLLDSGGYDPDPQVPEALFDERLLAARPLDLVRATCKALVARSNAATEAFVARRCAEHPAGADYRAVARSSRGAVQDDAPRNLHRIPQPVTILHGSRDILVPLPLVQRVSKAFPNATLQVLDGVGHMPWLEIPDAVAAHVRALTL